MSSRSAAAKKAWVTRRAGRGSLVGRKDVKISRVSGRLAEYIDFRQGAGRLGYATNKQRGESRAQVARRLGVANVKPLKGGILLKRRPSSVPGLSPSARKWIDGLGFPLGEPRGR